MCLVSFSVKCPQYGYSKETPHYYVHLIMSQPVLSHTKDMYVMTVPE